MSPPSWISFPPPTLSHPSKLLQSPSLSSLRHRTNSHWQYIYIHSISSVAQSCPTLCDPMDCSTPGFPVHHQLPELAQTHVHWISDAIQPCHLCHPLLLPPSIFPSITGFSNGSALCIRWPKYWSFSFIISPFLPMTIHKLFPPSEKCISHGGKNCKCRHKVYY